MRDPKICEVESLKAQVIRQHPQILYDAKIRLKPNTDKEPFEIFNWALTHLESPLTKEQKRKLCSVGILWEVGAKIRPFEQLGKKVFRSADDLVRSCKDKDKEKGANLLIAGINPLSALYQLCNSYNKESHEGYEFLLKLLQEQKVELTYPQKKLNNWLLRASYHSSKTEFVKLLLELGAFINCCDHNGNTPLHNATYGCYLFSKEWNRSASECRYCTYYTTNKDAQLVLLQNGACPNKKNKDNKSAFYLEVSKINPSLDLFLHYNGQLHSENKKRWTPLLQLVRNSSDTALKVMANSTERDAHGQTIFHNIVRAFLQKKLKSLWIIDELLKRKVSVEIKDDDGITVLDLLSDLAENCDESKKKYLANRIEKYYGLSTKINFLNKGLFLKKNKE